MSESDFKAEVMDVTPELAEEWLGKNTHNRLVRPTYVRSLARDMANGQWHFDGAPIRFSAEGVLLDGQHRLHAVIRSGVTVSMLVLTNLTAESQVVMDTGRARTLGDVLKLQGEHNYIPLATTVRAINNWETQTPEAFAGFRPVSTPAALATLEKYPWVREGMTTVSSASKNANLSTSVGGLTWWMFMQIEPEDCTDFFNKLSHDLGHSEGDPIYHLRRALMDSRSPHLGNRKYMLAITIKAWNAYRQGEKVGHFRYRPGGSNPERMPEAI